MRLARVFSALLCAILVVVNLAAHADALPVQGNLVITGGEATIANGARGDFVSAHVAGPGFDVGFLACAENDCIRSTPGNDFRVIGPGQVFKPTVFSAPHPQGLLFYDGGSATILGVTYTGSGNFSTGPNSILFSAGSSPMVFDATFASPSFVFTSFQTVTLSAPFRFSGELILGFAGEFPDAFLDLHMSGQGQASINLFGPSGGGWFIGNSTFDFSPAPIPEPTTLLLWGTTMAGVGLARWRRR